jgi:hypothetical protein
MTNRRYIEASAEWSFLKRTAFATFAFGAHLLSNFFYQRLENGDVTNTFILPLLKLIMILMICLMIFSFVSSLSIGAEMRKRSAWKFRSYDDEYLNYVAKTASAISTVTICLIFGLTYVATIKQPNIAFGITVSLHEYAKLALAITSLAYATPIIFLLWKKDE